MKILVDRDIPYIDKLFGVSNDVRKYDGCFLCSNKLQDIDALVVRSVIQVNQNLLAGHDLKFIGTVTSGIDHIDQDYLIKSGIHLACALGSNSIAVVEYVLSALFWLAQRDRFVLRDKTVGIVGVGHIGALLNRRLCALGINTLLCDPPLQETKKFMYDNWKSLTQLVSEADILTFHTPLIYGGHYSTWHMVNFDVLDALSANTILINTSRGAVVDNCALLKILKYGKKLNVILDVWEGEPEISLELLSYIDIGTAHIAGYTHESKIRGSFQIYSEYCDFFNTVNKIAVSSLMPSVLQNIKISNRIDELLLFKLTKYVYDICFDDRNLRSLKDISSRFDLLRKLSLTRREWSSIYVDTNIDSDNDMLIQLGFSTHCI